MAMGCKRVNKTIWMAILMSIMAVAGVHADDYDFKSDGQLPGASYSTGVAVGYLDNDGRLDIFVANSGIPAQNDGMWNTIWLQNRDGSFEQKDQNSATEGVQGLGFGFSTGVALGDLDHDGDVDAFVTNNGEANRVWLNNGNGTFSSGGSLGSSYSTGVALGDLDHDGDVDVFVTNQEGQPNEVWLNNDNDDNFTKVQELGDDSNSMGVALGDLNGDGYLDAFVVNSFPIGAGPPANKVWINKGDDSGTFDADHSIDIGDSSSMGVALGDLDGDGDVDAFVVNNAGATQYDRIWLNNGTGIFQAGDALDNRDGTAVALADFDEDGDLDAFVANQVIDNENTVWRNNGDGTFSDSYQALGRSDSQDVALADINDDGYMDAVVANMLEANTLWRIDGPPSSGGGGGGGGGCFVTGLIPFLHGR